MYAGLLFDTQDLVFLSRVLGLWVELLDHMETLLPHVTHKECVSMSVHVCVLHVWGWRPMDVIGWLFHEMKGKEEKLLNGN